MVACSDPAIRSWYRLRELSTPMPRQERQRAAAEPRSNAPSTVGASPACGRPAREDGAANNGLAQARPSIPTVSKKAGQADRLSRPDYRNQLLHARVLSTADDKCGNGSDAGILGRSAA